NAPAWRVGTTESAGGRPAPARASDGCYPRCGGFQPLDGEETVGVDRARRTRCVRSSIRAAVAHAAGGVNTRFEKGIVRLHPKGHSGALSLSLEEQFLYPLLFRAGWWLFFAGSVFLGWNSLGILVLLLHTLLDRRALTGLWRSAQQAVGPVVLSLGRWRMPLNYILVGLGLTGLASSALAVEPARAAAATAGMLLSIVFGLVYALLLEQVQPGWYRAYLWPAVVAGAGHIAWVFWEASQLESLWYRVETIGGPNGTGTLMLLAVVLALPWFAASRDGRRWLRSEERRVGTECGTRGLARGPANTAEHRARDGGE